MVSFDHTPLSPPPPGKIIHQEELEGFSKKRKLFKYESEYEEFSEKSIHHHHHQMMMNCITSSTDLHLETPLPSEWQRCLDIKSGKLYFYNTRTQKRASSDSRSSPEPPPSSSAAPAHMSLDLELNLPCGSSMAKNYHVTENFTKLLNSSTTATVAEDHHHHQFTNSGALKNTTTNNNNNNNNNNNTGIGSALSRSPSWLTFEGEQEEMVTAVCKKCHMLVMMCKSSPACPNCKFMHSPDQSTPTLFKSRSLSLLC